MLPNPRALPFPSGCDIIAVGGASLLSIYLDNAATSWPKCPQVITAMQEYLCECGGSPGRAGHGKSLTSSRMVYDTRDQLATLFNALVKARAYAADQLFATLDTTTRQLYLVDAGRSVSLSDTVGFIRDLPHGLIDAFQATLQEAVDADLLLHVVDAANPHFPEQISQVQRVLSEIGAADIKQVLLFNKLDALAPEQRPQALEDSYEMDGRPVSRIFVSARTGEGLDTLRHRLAAIVLAVHGPSMTLGLAPDLPQALD